MSAEACKRKGLISKQFENIKKKIKDISMRIKLLLILPVLTCIIIGGCRPSEYIEPEQSQQTLPIVEANKIAIGLYKYHEIQGNFPMSKEVFQEFCLESNLPCGNVDFNKVSWKSIDNKKIVVIYTSDEYSFPISLELDLDSSDLIDTLQYKLKENMQDLTEDRQ